MTRKEFPTVATLRCSSDDTISGGDSNVRCVPSELSACEKQYTTRCEREKDCEELALPNNTNQEHRDGNEPHEEIEAKCPTNLRWIGRKCL